MKDDTRFDQVMADVTPLKVAERVAVVAGGRQTPGLERRRRAAAAEAAVDANFLSIDHVPPVGPYDIVGFVRPGVQHGVYGKLRRGRYEPQATLDLHRRSAEQARRELWQFVEDCSECQLRTVMVLHGKGDRSPQAGVLKSYVCHWCTLMPQVLAYHSAQPYHGGAGALYVLLKKAPQAREQNRERFLNKRHD